MPAKKKDIKHDEPVFVDSEGVFIHEAEEARYSGGVRTLASGVLPASMIANNPSLAAALNNNTNYTSSTNGYNAEGDKSSGAASGGSNVNANNSPGKKGKNKTSSSLSTTHNTADGKTTITTNASSSHLTHDGANKSMSNETIAAAAASSNNSFEPDGVFRFRHGSGTYISPQLRYCGEWKEDVMHGNGTLEFKKSGASYSGSFVNGMFCGHGQYVWKDGSCYNGNWMNNKMHGQGTFTDANGEIWNGIFYNGTGPGLERLYRAKTRTE